MPKGNSPVLAGTGAPAAGLGNVGDLYLDTASSLLYGPKTLAGWGTGTELRGQQGEQGLQGPQGIQGIQGEQGPQGSPGLSSVSSADDVVIENLSDGDILRWSQSAWRNINETSLLDGGNFVFILFAFLGVF
jgi:hypothetical protein